MINKRITKIKVKKGQWYFAWEAYKPITKSWDEYTLACKDPAREELKACMDNLVQHVIQICELNEMDKLKMIVSGIAESYGKDNRYITITAQKQLERSKSPLIINTPVRAERAENYAETAYCMSAELVDDLYKLEQEAWRYIEGDRAQQKLDFNVHDGVKDKSKVERIGA